MPDWAVFDDESLRRGYTVIPNRVFELPGLTPGAKYLYMHLLCLARQDACVTPRQTELMGALEISRNTLRHWFEELERHRLLRRESRAGVLQTVHFLELSTAGLPDEGSESNPLSETDGRQESRGTPSESDRVSGEGPSESDTASPQDPLDNGQDKDSKKAPPKSPQGGGSGKGSDSAKRSGKRRKAETKLSPEQNAVKQAGVDHLHRAIRKYTGLANPPAYSDAAAAGYFAERILERDTERDLIEGVDEYIARLKEKNRQALRLGKKRHHHGSFAGLKATWGSILQTLVHRREEHARAVRGSGIGAGVARAPGAAAGGSGSGAVAAGRPTATRPAGPMGGAAREAVGAGIAGVRQPSEGGAAGTTEAAGGGEGEAGAASAGAAPGCGGDEAHGGAAGGDG